MLRKISHLVALSLYLIALPAGAGPLPDSRLTPGDVFDVSPHDVCNPGYAGKVRNVPESLKRKVFVAYGIPWAKRRSYEVDHLIPLEIGGSNSIRNLWPQSYAGKWNARIKDLLENRLHALVCSGRIDLTGAQMAIAGDWITAYKKYIGP